MFSRSQGRKRRGRALHPRARFSRSVRLTRAFGAEVQQEQLFELANQNALRRPCRDRAAWLHLAAARRRGLARHAARALPGTAMVREGSSPWVSWSRFLAYVESLKWPTMGLGYIMAVLQRGLASFQRVREILEAPPDVRDAPGARSPGRLGEVRVHDLSYSFGDRSVLEEVGFAVRSHGSLAILGRTGSGKSTLAALPARILPTPDQRVFLDGDDIVRCACASCDARSLRAAGALPVLGYDWSQHRLLAAGDQLAGGGRAHPCGRGRGLGAGRDRQPAGALRHARR